MNIAENIRYYRILNKMEQSELAKLLHISNKTVSSWECGRTEPRMGMIEEMCNIFNCNKTDLIDGTYSDSSSEISILFNSLNPEGQDLLIKYGKFLMQQPEYIKNHSVGVLEEA